jgi:tetratricopeptide (TPR) repeat protein
MTGLRLEQFYNPSYDPEPYYVEALRREPEDYRVNTAYGLMKLRNGNFIEAEKHLQTAVSRITNNHTKARDGEAYYYLGLCQKYQHKYHEAYKNLYLATWSQAFHTAGYYQLAELSSLKGDYSMALEHVERSLVTNSKHNLALNLKSALLRNNGRFEEALKVTAIVRDYDPLDYRALCEAYFSMKSLGENDEASALLLKIKDLVHGYEHSYLELSLEYANSGLWQDAIFVLSEIFLEGDENKDAYPLVYYYLGYFNLQAGEEEAAMRLFNTAMGQSPDYCFPFRLESIRILEEASALNSSDPTAPLYLGILLFDMQAENALLAWKKSALIDDKFWLVHRNLGMAYNKVEKNIDKAIGHYLTAIELKPDDQRLLYEVDLLLAASREDPETRLKLLQDHHEVIANNNVSDALSREVMLLTQLGRYEESLQVAGENHFKQWEGVSKA